MPHSPHPFPARSFRSAILSAKKPAYCVPRSFPACSLRLPETSIATSTMCASSNSEPFSAELPKRWTNGLLSHSVPWALFPTRVPFIRVEQSTSRHERSGRATPFAFPDARNLLRSLSIRLRPHARLAAPLSPRASCGRRLNRRLVRPAASKRGGEAQGQRGGLHRRNLSRPAIQASTAQASCKRDLTLPASAPRLFSRTGPKRPVATHRRGSL